MLNRKKMELSREYCRYQTVKIFLIIFLSVFWGLLSCTTYVKDAFTFEEDQVGLINEHTYQFWYKTSWAIDRYYVDALQIPREDVDPVRFVSLIEGARYSITKSLIRTEINRLLSILRCRNENTDIINQISLNDMLYKIVKEEYYLNGTVKYLIQFQAKFLSDKVEQSSCF